MRDHLTHRYFDTLHEVVADVIQRDLPSLKLAVNRLRRIVADLEAGQTTLDDASDSDDS
jgi:uncharacterized protein with HEPN domain